MKIAYSSDDWAVVKRRRDELLAACDWTQLPDSPLTPIKKEEWQVYRQALRDIPTSFSTASAVVWPAKPGA